MMIGGEQRNDYNVHRRGENLHMGGENMISIQGDERSSGEF